jgi:hypothetical protein
MIVLLSFTLFTCFVKGNNSIFTSTHLFSQHYIPSRRLIKSERALPHFKIGTVSFVSSKLSMKLRAVPFEHVRDPGTAVF